MHIKTSDDRLDVGKSRELIQALYLTLAIELRNLHHRTLRYDDRELLNNFNALVLALETIHIARDNNSLFCENCL